MGEGRGQYQGKNESKKNTSLNQSWTEATHMLSSQCCILLGQPNDICCQLLRISVVQQALWVDPNVVSWTGPAEGARQHLILCHSYIQLRSPCEPFCTPEPAQDPYLRRGRQTKNCSKACMEIAGHWLAHCAPEQGYCMHSLFELSL